ncbi:MAG: hypothetical protein PVI40_04690 [Chlamydiota bacterium]|jgi:hypothetical protein
MTAITIHWEVERIQHNINILYKLGKENVCVDKEGNLQIDKRSFCVRLFNCGEFDSSRIRIYEAATHILQNLLVALERGVIEEDKVIEATSTPRGFGMAKSKNSSWHNRHQFGLNVFNMTYFKVWPSLLSDEENSAYKKLVDVTLRIADLDNYKNN